MKLQLNILLEPNEGIDYLFAALPRIVYPVIWFESEASLPEAMSGQLQLLVNLPTIMVVCGATGIVLGCLGMVAAIYCQLGRRVNNKSVGIEADLLDYPEYARIDLSDKEAEAAAGFRPTIIKSSTKLLSSHGPRIEA